MNAELNGKATGWAAWQRRAPLYGLAIGILALLIYWPGVLCILPGCESFRDIKPLRLVDLRLGDLIHRSFTPASRAERRSICVVGITENDVVKQPLPWAAKANADLLRILHDGGAKVIAFDFPLTEERKEDSALLSAEIRRSNNVILARCGNIPDPSMGAAPLIIETLARAGETPESQPHFSNGAFRVDMLPVARSFYDAARADGHINYLYDSDLRVRRVPVALGGADAQNYYLPLAVVAAIIAEGFDPADVRLEPKALCYGDVRIPMDASGCIPVSFVPWGRLLEPGRGEPSRAGSNADLSPRPAVRFFSYGDVIAGRAPREAFKDAIVLIGQCAMRDRDDLHLTPEGPEYGVQIQATLLDAVLNRRFIAPVSNASTVFSMLLLSILVGAVCFAVRFRVSSYATVACGFLLFALGAGLIVAALALLSRHGVVADASPFLLVIGLNLTAGMAVNAARSTRDANRRDMEMDLLLIAGRRQVNEVPDQDTPHASAIPGASQMAISASLSLRSPEIVAETFCQGIPCQGCVLFSIPEGNTLSFDRAVYHAFSPAFPRAEVERIAVRFAWETLKQSRPIIHSRHQRNWMFQEMNPMFLNLLGVPIIARGQPLAVAVLFNKRATPASPEREFTEDHLRLVSALRYQAAALLENARRYQLEYAMFDGFARSLAKAVDFRDNYTRGHSERVAELSAGLARELGLSEGEVEIVQRAATLHDLGKIGVNDMVLRKPGRLSDPEFSMIRAHAANGFEILKAAPSFEALLPGIRHHHERYDGAGYPDGLAGNAIPLIARIIAAADAYDAMTSNRPYRKALAEAKAREELRAGSGTQFDPQVVEALLSYLNKRGMDESSEVTQTAQVFAMLEADAAALNPPTEEQSAIVPPPR